MSQFFTPSSGGGGGGVTSITGNTGPAQTGAINLITANSTPIFAGAAGTITLDFALTDNLFLGSGGGSITSGNTNVGYGKLAAASISSGASNSFIGYESGVGYSTGSNSTAVGAFSMFNAIAGASNNTAIGYSSLYNMAGAGTGNTCLGLNSCSAYLNVESNNIIIGNTGVVTENGVTRIGTNAIQTSAYIAGIDGVNVGSVATVVTEAGDQLGTAVITAGAGISVTPSANAITITATGSAPALSSAFFSYVSAIINNVTGDGTVYTVLLDSTLFNVGGDYDTTTGIFTAPSTGYYSFSLSTAVTNITAQTNFSMFLTNATSGTVYYAGIVNPTAVSAGGVYAYNTTVGPIHLMAGDEVGSQVAISGSTKTVNVYGSGAANLFTYFSGFLIGA